MSATSTFPENHEDLGHGTHLVDIQLQRPKLASCYVIQDGEQFALVDCGTAYSVPQVLATIAALGGTPEQVRWIIPTHVHLDHAGGAGQLMQACPNARLLVHPNGHPHMVDPSKLQAGATAVYGEAAFQADYDTLLPIASERTQAASDGERVQLGGRELSFVFSPGHANHHGVIFDHQSGYLFGGDTCGLGYQELAVKQPHLLATTSPVAFDPDAWQDTLDRIEALKPSAICLTHFGLYADPLPLFAELRDSVRAHAQIAIDEESNDSEGRSERLRTAVRAQLFQQAADTGLDEPTLDALLGGDIGLNAQGLEIWLARRAKARAKAAG